MLRTHRRKIIGDITSRKTRTLLVTLSVFVGVLGVVVLITLGELITRQLEKDLNPREMAMLRVYLDQPAGRRADNEAVLQLLRSRPGVTDVEGQAVFGFQWKLPEETEFRNGQMYAYSEPFGSIDLEPVRLVRGRYPTPDAGEIAIEIRMAQKYGIRLGDTIIAQRNGFGTAELKVVGFIFQPYLYVGSTENTESVYLAYSDAQNILRFTGFSSLYVRFTDFGTARERSPEFRRVITNLTPYSIAFYLLDNPQKNAFIVGARQFSQVLTILALVAMVVANFLVTNVINTIVAEQRQQIGAMKAIGATSADILIIYLGLALVYGVLGTIPGVLAGLPIGRAVAVEAAPIANTLLEDTTPPLIAVVVGLGMGLAVPVLAALPPVLSGARVTILEAMTDQGISSSYGKGPLAALIARSPLPATLEHAVNNILRHKSRLALTLLTLTLATASFMGMYAVFDRLNGVITDIRAELRLDFSVDTARLSVFSVMQSLLSEEPISEIQPGVAVEVTVNDPVGDAETTEETAASEEAPHIFVTAVDPMTNTRDITLIEGTGWQEDPARSGVVITEEIADRFGKGVGDEITLSSAENTRTYPIIGIAEYPLQTAFMPADELAAFIGTLRDAPEPNAYWREVTVANGDLRPVDLSNSETVWAVGIDERVGRFLAPSFSVDQPAVIVSRNLADALGVTEGDTLALRPAGDSLIGTLLDPPRTDFPILRVVDIDPAQISFILRQAPEGALDASDVRLIALHWTALADLVHEDYREFTPRTFRVDLADPFDPRLFARPVPVYSDQVDFADRVADTILSLGVVMSFAALLMGLVGGIGLFTLTSISVHERQREIGVMRSVGATSSVIIRQFLTEGIVLGLGAWLLALPLSYFLSRLLLASVPFNEVIRFEYTLLAPLLGLAGVLIITVLATLYPAIRASQKTVAEILRYQ